MHIAVIHSYTQLFKNFRFPLPKYSGRQILRKFRVHNIYPKLRGLNIGFSNRNFGFSNRIFGFWSKVVCFANKFFSSYRNFGCWFWNFYDWNFGISNPYKVFDEVSVERKPEKFSKFPAKMQNEQLCFKTGSYGLKTRSFGFKTRYFGLKNPKFRFENLKLPFKTPSFGSKPRSFVYNLWTQNFR
jgi:hypothetical protein